VHDWSTELTESILGGYFTVWARIYGADMDFNQVGRPSLLVKGTKWQLLIMLTPSWRCVINYVPIRCS
jgi:hypothetical protein